MKGNNKVRGGEEEVPPELKVFAREFLKVLKGFLSNSSIEGRGYTNFFGVTVTFREGEEPRITYLDREVWRKLSGMGTNDVDVVLDDEGAEVVVNVGNCREDEVEAVPQGHALRVKCGGEVLADVSLPFIPSREIGGLRVLNGVLTLRVIRGQGT